MINYIAAFFSGLAIGVPMCFALGPVFFALLQNSMSNGFRSALFIAMGVIIADVILFGAAYTGTHLFIEGQDTNKTGMNFWVELVGGIILVLMGFFTIRKHIVETNERKFFHNPFMYFMRGFALNFLNPINFFAWVILVANVNLAYITTGYRFTFYIATLISIFVTEVTIAHFARRITRMLNDKTLRLISTGNGMVFAGCGLWLLGIAFGFF